MITKTLFTTSLQCLKLAHRTINQPESLQETTLGIQFRKNQGMNVGELTKKLYPEGIDLSNQSDEEKIKLTQNHKTKVLFEASIKYKDLFARADILIPNKDGSHNIIEVKSVSKIKDEHIADISFQKYVFEKAGYKIRYCYITHANSEYVRQGDLDIQNFFTTDLIEPIIMESELEHLRNSLSKKEPEVPIGRHCSYPYDCPMKKECWSFLPKNNVTQLYYDKKKGFELLEKGILKIKDIDSLEPKGRGKREREIQLQTTKDNAIHIQKEDIKNWVHSLIYPIYYFDFETYAPAIPLFNNARPWQRIPFQYSVHIEYEDGTIEHKDFLSTENKDPRKDLIKSMQEHLGIQGSIVVYNQIFEKSVIEELMRDLPEFEDAGNNFLSRIVDLAHPFQYFWYYNPEQQGRYSIKVILPLFSDLSYKGMGVANGEEAFCAFENILHGDFSKVKDLKEYCKLDTLAEIKIVEKLRKI